MTVLRDTHSFLWFLLDDPRLSGSARDSIAEPANDVQVSPATYWEVAIKISLGKYSLPEPFAQFMERHLAINRFAILHIQPRHAAALTDLPFHHRDPFDRLIIAQAMAEDIPVISGDEAFAAYPVNCIW